MKKIHIQDVEINFLKKSGQKSVRLRMDKNGIIFLSTPLFYSEKKAIAFASEHIDWIREQTQKQPLAKTILPNQTIFLLGKTLTVIHTPQKKTGVFIEGDYLYVCGEISFIHRRICDFAKKQLLIYIQEKAMSFGNIIQQYPTRISLRDTTSRWGSCSSRKTLSFCWKLAFSPIFVIDYIVAHEVAHLKEMNHAKGFWETVALFNTNQADAQIWLRKHGRELQAWK